MVFKHRFVCHHLLMLAALLFLISLISSCKTNQNSGGPDCARVSLSVNQSTPSGNRVITTDAFVSSLILVVPESLTSVSGLGDIPDYHDRAKLSTDGSVELSVPLNTALRIAQLSYDTDLTFKEMINAANEPEFSGVSEVIQFSGSEGSVSVSLALSPAEGPLVLSTTPASGDTGVALKPNFSVTFDQAVDPSSMIINTTDTSCSGSVQISADNFQTCVRFSDGSGTVSTDGMTFSADPVNHLLNLTEYSLKITTAVTNMYGRAMSSDFVMDGGFATLNFYENTIPSASGSLDVSFGSSGKLVQDIGSTDVIQDISVTDDGKILILVSLGDDDPLVWKVDDTGANDNSFGESDGDFKMSVGGALSINTSKFSLGSAGEMYIVGTFGGGTYDMRIWSYTAAGSANTGFNSNGYMDEVSANSGYAIATYVDGDILVGGDNGGGVAMLMKVNPDGSYDTDFGTNGFADIDGDGYDTAYDIVIDAYDRIVVCGNRGGYNVQDMALWRFDGTGAPDSSFSDDGFVSHADAAGGSGYDNGYAVRFDENGNILVVGSSSNGTDNDLIVWKFKENGTLDTSFGTNGFYQYDGGDHDLGRDIAVDGSGKIVVVGKQDNGSDSDMLILRLNSDGTLDTGFGSGGTIIEQDLAGGANKNDLGFTVELMDNGDILAGGSSVGSDTDAVILKYN